MNEIDCEWVMVRELRPGDLLVIEEASRPSFVVVIDNVRVNPTTLYPQLRTQRFYCENWHASNRKRVWEVTDRDDIMYMRVRT